MKDYLEELNDYITAIESSPGYAESLLKNKLIDAVRNNNVNTVMDIIYKDGLDVHSFKNGEITPLMWASQYGFIDIMLIMINLQVDVNQMSYGGYTALSDAVVNNNLEAVQLLLTHGADKSIVNSLGHSLSEMTKNVDILELLT